MARKKKQAAQYKSYRITIQIGELDKSGLDYSDEPDVLIECEADFQSSDDDLDSNDDSHYDKVRKLANDLLQFAEPGTMVIWSRI